MCGCGAVALQIRRLLLRIGRLLVGMYTHCPIFSMYSLPKNKLMQWSVPCRIRLAPIYRCDSSSFYCFKQRFTECCFFSLNQESCPFCLSHSHKHESCFLCKSLASIVCSSSCCSPSGVHCGSKCFCKHKTEEEELESQAWIKQRVSQRRHQD